MNDTPQFWKQWWNDCAKNASSDYTLNRGTSIRLERLEQEAQERLIRDLSPRESDVVLDAGCGSGRNISLLAHRVKKIVALDFAPEMLNRVNDRIALEGLANISPVLGSVTKLPFADGLFDKVICTSVLQYLSDEDCRLAFDEISRVCKPGGLVVVHLKNGSSLYGLSKSIANRVLALVGRRGLPEYYRSWRLHEEMIRNSGSVVTDFSSFGIFTFVGLPKPLVRPIFILEMKLPDGRWLRRFGVNCQISMQVVRKPNGGDKSAAASRE